MGLSNGVHHLAICTKDIKVQIEFFTKVCGMELVALYWMHGVKNTFHGFLKLGESSSVAFVQSPEIGEIQPVLGVSHAAWTASPVAPGTMQHMALNVDTEEDLLTMRDRVRSHGYWVMGPINHGFCKSIYFAAPEGIMMEFSTSEGKPINGDAWIDPDVVKLCKINADELRRYKDPSAFESQGGTVPQPAREESKLLMQFPPEMQAIYKMTDEEIAARLSETTPPVQPTR